MPVIDRPGPRELAHAMSTPRKLVLGSVVFY